MKMGLNFNGVFENVLVFFNASKWYLKNMLYYAYAVILNFGTL